MSDRYLIGWITADTHDFLCSEKGKEFLSEIYINGANKPLKDGVAVYSDGPTRGAQ